MSIWYVAHGEIGNVLESMRRKIQTFNASNKALLFTNSIDRRMTFENPPNLIE